MRSLLPSCFFVAMGCGTLYIYSAYAPQLSDRLSLTATQVSSIGIIGNLAMSISGPFAGHLVDKYGFLYPIIVSGLCNLTGYTLIRVCFVNQISSMALLAMALILIGISSTFAFSSSVKCAAINRPHDRGFATSVVMAGYGLSAFALSAISGKVAKDSTEGMISVLSFFPTALMIVFGPEVVLNDPSIHPRKLHPEDTIDYTPEDEDIDGPIRLVPLRLERGNDLVAAASKPKDLGVSQIVRLPSFWCYCILLGFIAAMGQTYIYSCGYMVKALVELENEREWQSKQVAILSIANFGGRVLAGFVSDLIKNKMRQSRDWTLALAISVCLIAQIGGRLATDLRVLNLLSICTGIYYGICFGAFPGIVGDAYGIEHFSSNWGVVALSPITVSYYLTRRLGRLYDANTNANGVCMGSKCFSSSFTLTIVISIGLYGVLLYLLRIKDVRKR